MTSGRKRWQPWGDHPVVALVSVLAGLLAISAPFVPAFGSRGTLAVYSTSECRLSIDGEDAGYVGTSLGLQLSALSGGPSLGPPVERTMLAGTHYLECSARGKKLIKAVTIDAGRRSSVVLAGLDLVIAPVFLEAKVKLEQAKKRGFALLEEGQVRRIEELQSFAGRVTQDFEEQAR